MEEATDAYIAHNWGKIIPDTDPPKYDNHERVRLVNK
jgi:hypothetical protein